MGSAGGLQEGTRPRLSVLVDTSVWSLALRRDPVAPQPIVGDLRRFIESGDVHLLGVILQEVLQGFPDAAGSKRLTKYLSPFPILTLNRADFIFAAEVRNRCRLKGLAVSTIDAQIAAAAISHRCTLFTVDADFERIARHFPLRIHTASTQP